MGKKVAFVPLLIGSYSPDLLSKWRWVPRVFADELNASPARPGVVLVGVVGAIAWAKCLRQRE